MHENINDFIFEIFIVALFIVALSLFVVINRVSLTSINVVKENTMNTAVVYEGTKEMAYEEKTYGYEIVAKIIKGLDYNIKVGSDIITKETSSEDIDLSIIDLDRNYHLTRVLNGQGEIDYLYYY